MKFSAVVEVSGLEGIADPEGQTIERSLPALGFEHVEHVSVGKLIRFDLEAADEPEARRRCEDLCRRLLANPVIERFEVRVVPADVVPDPVPASAAERHGS